MITITIFSSSLFFSIIILALKASDLKKGKTNFFYTLVGRFDDNSVRITKNIKFRSLQIIQSLRYIFLVKIKDSIISFVTSEIKRISDEYDKRQRIFMGHKDISTKGAVSFYLKRIQDEKNIKIKGKIE